MSFLRIMRIALRMLLGGTFLYAAATKLPDMAGFAQVIGGFGLMPVSLLSPVAVLLVGLELLTGAALLAGVRLAVPVAAAQLLLFMAVLGWGMHLGLDVDCGCFGPADPEGDFYHGMDQALWRDAALLAACALLWRLSGRGDERQNKAMQLS